MNYASTKPQHGRFVVDSTRVITAAEKDIAALDRKATAAAADVKEQLEQQNAACASIFTRRRQNAQT